MATVLHGRVGVRIREGAAAAVPTLRDGLVAEILPGLDAAEAVWRSLDASPDGFATPYQRFDWAAAYLDATDEAVMARVAVLRDRTGRVRMLMPLVLRLEYGLIVAHSVGDDFANYHLPVFANREAAAVSAEDVRSALVAAGRSAGIDVYAFAHQPRTWDGLPNPLAAGGEAERADAYGLTLGPDAEATSRKAFSGDARKKLRSKEKRLVEALGPVEVRRAETGEEAAAFLAAFYEQKSSRFAEMGIEDPYAPEAVRQFLDRAACGAEPAMEVHALRLTGSGRILAVFGGAVNGSRYSGMMTSFAGDTDVSRYSPGDLLLYHLMRDQAARGRTGFDLGIGDARYKASVCDETIALVKTLIPISGRGQVFALAGVGYARLKRRAKASPRLFAFVARLRNLGR